MLVDGPQAAVTVSIRPSAAFRPSVKDDLLADDEVIGDRLLDSFLVERLCTTAPFMHFLDQAVQLA